MNNILELSDTSLALRNNEEAQLKTNDTLPAIVAQHYIHAATSDNTRNAYKTDIRHFIAWGGSLPTSTDVVMHYLHQHAESLNPRTLMRRLTALKNWHQYQGFNDPTAHSVIRKTITGIKNTHGKPKNKAPALTLESLTQMVAFLKKSNRLIDCRNCALLQIGFFGAFRRSELVNITWGSIRFVKEGIEILISRSKTDQAGEGQVCAIPYGDDILCPVSALIAWRDRSNCQADHHVFRHIKFDEVSNKRIQPRQVNMLIKRIAEDCHIHDAKSYSSHSFRRGFATEASKKNVPFASIKRQGRWRYDGSVLGYIDEGKLFDQNAAGIMLNQQRNQRGENANKESENGEQSKTPTNSE